MLQNYFFILSIIVKRELIVSSEWLTAFLQYNHVNGLRIVQALQFTWRMGDKCVFLLNLNIVC